MEERKKVTQYFGINKTPYTVSMEHLSVRGEGKDRYFHCYFYT
jgi:hypothetical protein